MAPVSWTASTVCQLMRLLSSFDGGLAASNHSHRSRRSQPMTLANRREAASPWHESSSMLDQFELGSAFRLTPWRAHRPSRSCRCGHV